MRFEDAVKRLRGLSIGYFGLQWEPPADQRRMARDLLDKISNRRVLYAPLDQEVVAASVNSVRELRTELATAMSAAPDDSIIYKNAKRLQRACRIFLTRVETLDFDASDQPTAIAVQSIFNRSLVALRDSAGHAVAELVAAYGLDVKDEVAFIIPFSDAR